MKDTHHTPEWRKRVEGMKKDIIIKIRPLMAGGGYPDPHAIGYNQAIDDLIPIIEEAVAEFAREVAADITDIKREVPEHELQQWMAFTCLERAVEKRVKERGIDL